MGAQSNNDSTEIFKQIPQTRMTTTREAALQIGPRFLQRSALIRAPSRAGRFNPRLRLRSSPV